MRRASVVSDVPLSRVVIFVIPVLKLLVLDAGDGSRRVEG
jgi:hypothetical protein